MKTSARLALFVVAVLFAAVEMRAQDSSKAVRPRVVAIAAQAKQDPPPQPIVSQEKPVQLAPKLPTVEAEQPQKKLTTPASASCG